MIEKHAALRERRRTDTASCVRDRYSVHLAAAASAIPYLSCSLAVARHSLELQPSPHHRLLLIMAERPMVRHALSELQHGIRGATAARAQVKSSSSSSDTLLPRSSPTASCVPTSPNVALLRRFTQPSAHVWHQSDPSHDVLKTSMSSSRAALHRPSLALSMPLAPVFMAPRHRAHRQPCGRMPLVCLQCLRHHLS